MTQNLKQFFFFTKEGFTEEPNGLASENLQILGDATGVDLLDAFNNFKQNQPYLRSSSYKEVMAIETVGNVIYNLEFQEKLMSKLIPDTMLKTLPPLYATEDFLDPLVSIKLFTPDSSWTWYITEYDPEERLCFGLVHGQEQELGYFSLTELEELRGPMGLSVERDLYFQPTRLSAIREQAS